ncbi:hypothetical protein NECAME_02809 [Necator americanus]|uniref:Uncharacterized protein n=1 Tax=Necator americanus TaxID=51031 RepID=W2TCC4_NECAM|nr:hypothetical protein NECAME_02809 [Necator americanus]ETN78662.1 hypothetical protein NECAME_02809 [Necator americanus]
MFIFVIQICETSARLNSLGVGKLISALHRSIGLPHTSSTIRDSCIANLATCIPLCKELITEFVQRIDRFSRTQKVAVRNFTCEIAPLVLTNFDLSDPDPGLYDEIDNVNKTIAQAGDATTSTVVLEPKQEELQGYSDEEDGTSAINSSSENDGDSDKENNQKKEKTKIPKRTLAQ